MSFSNYLESKLLKRILRMGVFPAPMIWLGLSNIPTEDDPAELPSMYGYKRIQTSSAHWSVASFGRVTNVLELQFPTVHDGDWGHVSHLIWFDSGTYGEGNMLMYGALYSSWHLTEGMTPMFAVGEVEITLT